MQLINWPVRLYCGPQDPQNISKPEKVEICGSHFHTCTDVAENV